MEIGELLYDAFSRIREEVHEVVDGLTSEQLCFRPDGDANSIAWLVWHLTRIEDDHIAGVADTEQLWVSKGWMKRFDLPFEPSATGYGHSGEEVGKVRASAEILTGYHDAVFEHTTRYVRALDAADLDRIVDEHWDPPVTLGVRLVSIVSDDLQHTGQAAYIKGLATFP